MNIKRIVAMATATILAVSAMSLSAFAYVENKGYLYADTLSLSQKVTTDKLTSATDEHWYKFTTTEANSAYTLQVYNTPTAGAYRFELRYQDSTSTRPIIINNSGALTSSDRWTMQGVLTDAGTYYVRVYSATGEYSSSAYTFSVSISTNMHLSYQYLPSVNVPESRDWAACAEMVGKYYYYKNCGAYPNRTYKNAMKFILSGGTKENGLKSDEETNMDKPVLDDVVTAVNYVYSGDYMSNPMFVADYSMYTVPDFMAKVWQLSKIDITDHVIIKTNHKNHPTDETVSKYYVVIGAHVVDDPANDDIGQIKVMDSYGSQLEIDYFDLINTGYATCKYQGENIVRVGY